MSYKEFKKELADWLAELLGEGCKIEEVSVQKNNGAALDGLTVRREGSDVSPVIYTRQYYERYEKGEKTEVLAREIAEECESSSDLFGETMPDLLDFSAVRGSICYRLINTESNAEFLKDVPSVPYLDMSVIFYLPFNRDDMQFSAVIRNSQAEIWGTDADELYRLAEKNTPRINPVSLFDPRTVIGEARGKRTKGTLFHVLSNEHGQDGAAAILYPGVMKNAAKSIGDDLIVLPSSIHEFLLLPYRNAPEADELRELVANVNENVVSEQERLSGSVYLYSRESGKLSILAEGSLNGKRA